MNRADRHILLHHQSLKPFIIAVSALIYFIFAPPPVLSSSSSNALFILDLDIFTQGQEDDRVLKDIIYSTIEIEFERAGVTIISSLKEENEKAAVGILVCDVYEEDDKLRIELNLTSSDYPQLTAGTIKEVKIDLEIDAVISDAVSEIIFQISDYLPALTAKQKEKVSQAVEPEQVELIVEESRQADEVNPIRTSVSAAPFLAVGSVNYYFNLGVITSLQGGYTFTAPIGNIEAGICMGLLFFQALGLEDSSRNFIFPLGAVGRWGSSTNANFDVFISLSSGPALFVMQLSEDEKYSKISFFISAGGGVSLMFSDLFGVTVQVDYLMFFEKYYPIMGIVPSLYFDVRFDEVKK
ncbi:MAG TPA: hypothetical protein DCO79_08460 [Spirochaeta sp.]|nr:hypothetical protein [Spirochaeta sp.]